MVRQAPYYGMPFADVIQMFTNRRGRLTLSWKNIVDACRNLIEQGAPDTYTVAIGLKKVRGVLTPWICMRPQAAAILARQASMDGDVEMVEKARKASQYNVTFHPATEHEFASALLNTFGGDVLDSLNPEQGKLPIPGHPFWINDPNHRVYLVTLGGRRCWRVGGVPDDTHAVVYVNPQGERTTNVVCQIDGVDAVGQVFDTNPPVESENDATRANERLRRKLAQRYSSDRFLYVPSIGQSFLVEEAAAADDRPRTENPIDKRRVVSGKEPRRVVPLGVERQAGAVVDQRHIDSLYQQLQRNEAERRRAIADGDVQRYKDLNNQALLLERKIIEAGQIMRETKAVVIPKEELERTLDAYVRERVVQVDQAARELSNGSVWSERKRLLEAEFKAIMGSRIASDTEKKAVRSKVNRQNAEDAKDPNYQRSVKLFHMVARATGKAVTLLQDNNPFEAGRTFVREIDEVADFAKTTAIDGNMAFAALMEREADGVAKMVADLDQARRRRPRQPLSDNTTYIQLTVAQVRSASNNKVFSGLPMKALLEMARARKNKIYPTWKNFVDAAKKISPTGADLRVVYGLRKVGKEMVPWIVLSPSAAEGILKTEPGVTQADLQKASSLPPGFVQVKPHTFALALYQAVGPDVFRRTSPHPGEIPVAFPPYWAPDVNAEHPKVVFQDKYAEPIEELPAGLSTVPRNSSEFVKVNNSHVYDFELLGDREDGQLYLRINGRPFAVLGEID